MAKVLVLYYSMYGHIETMAHAVAEGANRVDGVEVVVKRVPETMQAEAFAKAGENTKRPGRHPQELADYDAIIFGTPTRFGNMSGQMRTFLDQTGGLWASGALYGKLASVFSSTGTGGGEEQTITSTDYPCPSWDGDCADWLRRAGTVRCFPGSWRDTVWRDNHCRWGWFSSAKQ